MSGPERTPGTGPSPRTLHRADAGYTLISVLMAMFLLVVGTLSVSNLLTQTVALQTMSSVRTTGLDVARDYMEYLKSLPPWEIEAVDALAVNETAQPDPDGVFTVRVDVEKAAAKLKQITVVVTTPRTNPVELVTLIYDPEM